MKWGATIEFSLKNVTLWRKGCNQVKKTFSYFICPPVLQYFCLAVLQIESISLKKSLIKRVDFTPEAIKKSESVLSRVCYLQEFSAAETFMF